MLRLVEVIYLSSALETYHELEPEGQKQVLAAAVGQKGLSINNPQQNHHFQANPTLTLQESLARDHPSRCARRRCANDATHNR